MVKCEDAHAEQLALHFGGDRQAATGLLDRSESGRDHAVRTNGDFFLAHACNRERARLSLCDKFVRAHPPLRVVSYGNFRFVTDRRKSPQVTRKTSHEVKSQAARGRGGGNARCSL
jgi:hypothetical protein